jgi:hypothetical protein
VRDHPDTRGLGLSRDSVVVLLCTEAWWEYELPLLEN